MCEIVKTTRKLPFSENACGTKLQQNVEIEHDDCSSNTESSHNEMAVIVTAEMSLGLSQHIPRPRRSLAYDQCEYCLGVQSKPQFESNQQLFTVSCASKTHKIVDFGHLSNRSLRVRGGGDGDGPSQLNDPATCPTSFGSRFARIDKRLQCVFRRMCIINLNNNKIVCNR